MSTSPGIDPNTWLDKARARAAAATSGPWTWDEYRVSTLSGRAGGPETYTHDTDVLEASRSGECGCRSACTLEVTIEPGDRAFIAASRTDRSVMSAALRAVLDLHHAFSVGASLRRCSSSCDHCGAPFPCPTVVAVSSAVGEVDSDVK